jgi:hypothetical protein
LWRRHRQAIDRVSDTQVVTGLVDKIACPLRGLGPFAGTKRNDADIEAPVRQSDLLPRPGGLLAPGRGPPTAVGAVEDGLDSEGVVTPHSPTRRRRRKWPEPLDQVRRRLLDERADPIRAGVVERAINLREGGLKRLSNGSAVGDGLPTLFLVTRDSVKPFTQAPFGRDRLLGVLPGAGNSGLSGGDGFAIMAAPAARGGFLERCPVFGERLFGLLAGPDGIEQLSAGLIHFFAAVGGDGGVKLAQVGEGGGGAWRSLSIPNASGSSAVTQSVTTCAQW